MGADNEILEQLRELELDIYDCSMYNEEYIKCYKDEILDMLLSMTEVVKDV